MKIDKLIICQTRNIITMTHCLINRPSLIRQYESEFTREFHNSLSAALADVLKYVAKVTADTIKNGLVIKSDVDLDIEKAHQVGEIHSNGKWVWTEYSPGKFDWRTIVQASSAKQNNPWNEISQVSKFKTVNDCVNYLKQNKIIYNAQLDGMDLDSARYTLDFGIKF